MSFLSSLINSKQHLKHTSTIITLPDGRKLLQENNTTTTLQETSPGFVVDTKPDNIPSQITKNIFLGSQDCTEINILQKFQIDYVLSIGIEVEHHPEVIYKFTPCLDLPETNITEILKNDCLDFLNMVVSNDKRVLVHCNAGVSRSSAIVIGYLMLMDGLDYDRAYDIVKRVRVVARPNDGFVRQLKRLTWCPTP